MNPLKINFTLLKCSLYFSLKWSTLAHIFLWYDYHGPESPLLNLCCCFPGIPKRSNKKPKGSHRGNEASYKLPYDFVQWPLPPKNPLYLDIQWTNAQSSVFSFTVELTGKGLAEGSKKNFEVPACLCECAASPAGAEGRLFYAAIKWKWNMRFSFSLKKMTQSSWNFLFVANTKRENHTGSTQHGFSPLFLIFHL